MPNNYNNFLGSNIKYSFDFVNKENNWLLDISPMSGVLSNTEVQEIKFSLTCKTTINKSIVIPLQLEGILYIILYNFLFFYFIIIIY